MTDAPANPLTPKAEALILYQLAGLHGPFPDPEVRDDDGPSHRPLFTCIVTSQLNGESYPSGTFTEGSIIPVLIDAAGVVWYAKKKHSVDAAFARLLDAYYYRRLLVPELGRDEIRTTRRCLESPTLLPQHGNIKFPLKVGTPIPGYISLHTGLEAYWRDFIFQFKENYGVQKFSHSIIPRAALISAAIINSSSSLAHILKSGSLELTTKRNTDSFYDLVEDAKVLFKYTEKLKKCNYIAVDMEMDNDKAVTIISVTFPEADHLTTIVIDCIKLGNTTSLHLRSILSDPQILKIVHSCGSLDASSLFHSLGMFMCNVVDTQIMYGKLNPGTAKIGLIKLLQETFEEDGDQLKIIQEHAALKNVYQNLEWHKRPLQPEQKKYAALDTMHLPSALCWLGKQLTLTGPDCTGDIILNDIYLSSHAEAAKLTLKDKKSYPFECSSLYRAVQYNMLVGNGIGSDVDEAKFRILREILNWRYMVSSLVSAAEHNLIGHDIITATVIQYSDVQLFKLLDDLYALMK